MLGQVLIASAIAAICVAHLLADRVRTRLTRDRRRSWASRSLVGERQRTGAVDG